MDPQFLCGDDQFSGEDGFGDEDFFSGGDAINMLAVDEEEFNKNNVFIQDEVINTSRHSATSLPESWTIHSHVTLSPSSENLDLLVETDRRVRVPIDVYINAKSDALGAIDGSVNERPHFGMDISTPPRNDRQVALLSPESHEEQMSDTQLTPKAGVTFDWRNQITPRRCQLMDSAIDSCDVTLTMDTETEEAAQTQQTKSISVTRSEKATGSRFNPANYTLSNKGSDMNSFTHISEASATDNRKLSREIFSDLGKALEKLPDSVPKFPNVQAWLADLHRPSWLEPSLHDPEPTDTERRMVGHQTEYNELDPHSRYRNLAKQQRGSPDSQDDVDAVVVDTGNQQAMVYHDDSDPSYSNREKVNDQTCVSYENLDLAHGGKELVTSDYQNVTNPPQDEWNNPEPDVNRARSERGMINQLLAALGGGEEEWLDEGMPDVDSWMPEMPDIMLPDFEDSLAEEGDLEDEEVEVEAERMRRGQMNCNFKGRVWPPHRTLMSEFLVNLSVIEERSGEFDESLRSSAGTRPYSSGLGSPSCRDGGVLSAPVSAGSTPTADSALCSADSPQSETTPTNSAVCPQRAQSSDSIKSVETNQSLNKQAGSGVNSNSIIYSNEASSANLKNAKSKESHNGLVERMANDGVYSMISNTAEASVRANIDRDYLNDRNELRSSRHANSSSMAHQSTSNQSQNSVDGNGKSMESVQHPKKNLNPCKEAGLASTPKVSQSNGSETMDLKSKIQHKSSDNQTTRHYVVTDKESITGLKSLAPAAVQSLHGQQSKRGNLDTVSNKENIPPEMQTKRQDLIEWKQNKRSDVSVDRRRNGVQSTTNKISETNGVTVKSTISSADASCPSAEASGIQKNGFGTDERERQKLMMLQREASWQSPSELSRRAVLYVSDEMSALQGSSLQAEETLSRRPSTPSAPGHSDGSSEGDPTSQCNSLTDGEMLRNVGGITGGTEPAQVKANEKIARKLNYNSNKQKASVVTQSAVRSNNKKHRVNLSKEAEISTTESNVHNKMAHLPLQKHLPVHNRVYYNGEVKSGNGDSEDKSSASGNRSCRDNRQAERSGDTRHSHEYMVQDENSLRVRNDQNSEYSLKASGKEKSQHNVREHACDSVIEARAGLTFEHRPSNDLVGSRCEQEMRHSEISETSINKIDKDIRNREVVEDTDDVNANESKRNNVNRYLQTQVNAKNSEKWSAEKSKQHAGVNISSSGKKVKQAFAASSESVKRTGVRAAETASRNRAMGERGDMNPGRVDRSATRLEMLGGNTASFDNDNFEITNGIETHSDNEIISAVKQGNVGMREILRTQQNVAEFSERGSSTPMKHSVSTVSIEHDEGMRVGYHYDAEGVRDVDRGGGGDNASIGSCSFISVGSYVKLPQKLSLRGPFEPGELDNMDSLPRISEAPSMASVPPTSNNGRIKSNSSGVVSSIGCGQGKRSNEPDSNHHQAMATRSAGRTTDFFTSSLMVIDAPSEVRVCEACCVGLSVQSSVCVRNLTPRWITVHLSLSDVSVNGVVLPSVDQTPFIVKPKVILEPGVAENIKVTFVPRTPGVFVGQLNLISAPVGSSSASISEARMSNKQHPVMVTLQAVAEQPNIEIKLADGCSARNVLDFGSTAWTSQTSLTFSLINRSRADLPVILRVAAINTAWNCFSFDANTDCVSDRRLSSSLCCKARPHARAASSLHSTTLKGADSLGRTQPTFVILYFMAPPRSASIDEQSVGEFKGSLVIEVDKLTSMTRPLCRVDLLGRAGSVKLHTPRDVRSLEFDAMLGKQSRSLPLRNAGSLPVIVRLKTSDWPAVFSVYPDVVSLNPRETVEVHLLYDPAGCSGIPAVSETVSSLLLLNIQPNGPTYEIHLSSYSGTRDGGGSGDAFRSADAIGKVGIGSISGGDLNIGGIGSGDGGDDRVGSKQQSNLVTGPPSRTSRSSMTPGLHRCNSYVPSGTVRYVVKETSDIHQSIARKAPLSSLPEIRQDSASSHVTENRNASIPVSRAVQGVATFRSRSSSNDGAHAGTRDASRATTSCRSDRDRVESSASIEPRIKWDAVNCIDDNTNLDVDCGSETRQKSDWLQRISSQSSQSDNDTQTESLKSNPSLYSMNSADRSPLVYRASKQQQTDLSYQSQSVEKLPPPSTVGRQHSTVSNAYPSHTLTTPPVVLNEKKQHAGWFSSYSSELEGSLCSSMDGTAAAGAGASGLLAGDLSLQPLCMLTLLDETSIARQKLCFPTTQPSSVVERHMMLKNTSAYTVHWKITSFTSAYHKLYSGADVRRMEETVYWLSVDHGTLKPTNQIKICACFAPREVGTHLQHWQINCCTRDSSTVLRASCRIEMCGEAVRSIEPVLTGPAPHAAVASLSQSCSYLVPEKLLPSSPSSSVRPTVITDNNPGIVQHLKPDVPVTPGLWCNGKVSVQPLEMIFPRCKIGETKSIKLELRNKDNQIHVVDVIGRPRGPFTVRHKQLVLRVRHFLRVPVDFHPASSGRYVDHIKLTLDDDTENSFTLKLVGECLP